MFSRARRDSRAQPKRKPEISQDQLPTSPLSDSFSPSTRADSLALPSPPLPWADTKRPSSAGAISSTKSSSSVGPPILPPIRIASTQDLSEDGDAASLQLDFSRPFASTRGAADNASITSRQSGLRTQKSFEHFSRPHSAASRASRHVDLLASSTSSHAIPVSEHAPSYTASPVATSPKLSMRKYESASSNVTTTYITQDPMFPRSTSVSPLVPRFPHSASSITSRDSIDARSTRRTVSGGNSDREHKRKSRKVGRAVTGPTPPTNGGREELETAKFPDGSFDSPKMEASMFPTFTPATQPQAPPVMDRSFIDSRDRPYSQAVNPRSLNSPNTPNFTRPGYQATYNSTSPSTAASVTQSPQAQDKPSSALSKSAASTSTNTPSSTIGISFESTSAAFPAPQLVATRPKTEGLSSSIAGVQVPTHHTSGLKAQDSISTSSKAERRRTKLLNPMALLARRKASVEVATPDEEERNAPILTQARQKSVVSIDLDKIPEDFDPRIKGKIVHDFSVPRAPKRDFPPRVPYQTESSASPALKVEQALDDRSEHASEPAQLGSALPPQSRKSVHAPVFLEHLDHEPPTARVTSVGGVGAENRENKDFLARFSQQSSISTFSQESAILPPFARRSQTLDSNQIAAWRDDGGSWSSGRDSGGGRSSTGPLGDRESGISSFSAVSPITRSSDGTQNGVFSSFDIARGGFSPISPQSDRKIVYVEHPVNSASDTRPRTHSTATARQESSISDSSPAAVDVEGVSPEAHISQHTAADSQQAHTIQSTAGGSHPADIMRNTDEEHETTPRTLTATSSKHETSPRNTQKLTNAVEHTVKGGDGIVKRKSNASRFSFQLGSNDNDEEKALEDKFRESGMFSSKISRSARSADDDEDDDDYFDEDAINDMDEMELQTQDERETTTAPKSLVLPGGIAAPTNQEKSQPPPLCAVASSSTSIPSSATKARKGSVEGFFYAGEIPYVPNERELTYAEHPVFQTHSALADSRRESFQSALIDSYLAGSPTSPSGKGSSLSSSSPGTASGRNRSRQGSLQSVRAVSLHPVVPVMTPLAERTESSTPVDQTPQQERSVTPQTGQQALVDSAPGSLKFASAASNENTAAVKTGRDRAESDIEVKPQWTRTAGLWKQYKKEDVPNTTALPPSVLPSPIAHTTSQSASRPSDIFGHRGALAQGVRVRRSSGSSRQSRLSMATSRLASIKQQKEDIYFDDGQFEQDTQAPTTSRTDESSIDRMPIPDRGQKDFSQQRATSLGMIGIASDGPYPSMPVSDAARQRDSALLLQDPPLMKTIHSTLIPQRNPSADAKRSGQGLTPSFPPLADEDSADHAQRGLQAYHQALADATNRAAAEGRFARKASIVDGTPEPDIYIRKAMFDDTAVPVMEARITNIGSNQAPEIAGSARHLQHDDRAATSTEVATPGKMAFDFGFDAPTHEDEWIHEEEDDDIVAAANAEALAYDTDGFYGSEFGFYANARPGAGAEVEAINGGFFGVDGDDGLTRKRSVKEPNLTPITERSEFSTRNSYINLHGLASGIPIGVSSALSTPVLSRMPVNAFSDKDITTFEQLKQLRKNAFGGSDGSLGSQQKSSPTSQNFPNPVPMALGHSTGSSSSGDRLASSESPSQDHTSQRTSLAYESHSQSHSRSGSGTDTAVTYVRDQENGHTRWIMEKRRTSGLGLVEINREVVSDGWI